VTDPSDVILKQVVDQMRAMFAAEGIEVECITGESEEYAAKARATSDAVLKAGYLALAEGTL
jgi:hypothetical protein